METTRAGGRPRRVLTQVVGRAPGPSLVVIGGLHGNEPCGVRAVERVAEAFAAAPVELRGELVALAGNLAALAYECRFVARDLNRQWLPERVEALRAAAATGDTSQWAPEDREQWELLVELEAVFARATGPIHVLDLHSTSGDGGLFATVGDTLRNRGFALHLPVPIVLGLEEELEGTLLSYLTELGYVTVGFESGQHANPASIDHAEAAVWVSLEAAGLVARGELPEVDRARGLLTARSATLPHVVEIRYRHAIQPGDDFRMEPGYSNFEPVERGEILAYDRHGAVRAGERCRILMPLYQKQGEDGFFLIREVRRFWLAVSEGLRRVRSDRVVHWLPGVWRHPALPDAYVVNRRVARWFALEIFHLLGFRRHGRDGDSLLVARRRHDLTEGSPASSSSPSHKP